MKEIELVIKIPEDVYKKTIFYREFKDLNDCVTTIKALENGIPLPKGHGRLKDVDKILRENCIDIYTDYGWETKISSLSIENAQTIIEADKGK